MIVAPERDTLERRRELAARFDDQPVSADPLAFPGYEAQLERARERSQGEESVVCGTASAFGFPVVVIDFRFAFMGGSMGEATGRRIVAAVERARTERIPLLSLVASGGARMQEGMRSLIQMQACAGALARLRRDGVPHIALLRSPTTGGIWASFASLADVAIAERGATVSFAGPRVRAAVRRRRWPGTVPAVPSRGKSARRCRGSRARPVPGPPAGRCRR